MIIKRMYVSLGVLYSSDEMSKGVIEKAYKLSSLPYDEKKRIFELNANTQLYKAEMGCCIPNLDIIREEFERLDATNPYDNGLDYSYVRDIEIIWKESDSIEYLLVTGDGHPIQYIKHNL